VLVRVLPAHVRGRGRIDSREATQAHAQQIIRKLRKADRMFGEAIRALTDDQALRARLREIAADRSRWGTGARTRSCTRRAGRSTASACSGCVARRVCGCPCGASAGAWATRPCPRRAACRAPQPRVGVGLAARSDRRRHHAAAAQRRHEFTARRSRCTSSAASPPMRRSPCSNGVVAVLSDVLCEVGVTDSALWAGKGTRDVQAENLW